MKLPTAVVAVVLLAVAGYTQAPPPTLLPTSPLPVPDLVSEPPLPPRAPLAQEPTVDQMLDALEKLRAQKAELEKKERETVEAIGKKVEKQTERMRKLGIGEAMRTAEAKSPLPPSIPPPLLPSPRD